VIDCGYYKLKVFNPRMGMDSLQVLFIYIYIYIYISVLKVLKPAHGGGCIHTFA
jgi:hypothetical protein